MSAVADWDYENETWEQHLEHYPRPSGVSLANAPVVNWLLGLFYT